MEVHLTKKQTGIEEKTIDIPKGELVLLSNVNADTLTLGVFKCAGQITTGRAIKEGITLERLYTLYPEEFFGGNSLPLMSPKNGEREHTYDVSRRNIEFYIGQQSIVRKLSVLSGFGAHASLVAKLEEPYLWRPELK